MSDPNEKPAASKSVIFSSAFVLIVMLIYVLQEFAGFSILEGFGGGANDSQAEGSLQGAVDACRRAANAQLGSALLSSKMDARSTRYQEASKEYLVYLNVRLDGQDRAAYSYECTVSAVSQRVLRSTLNSPPGTAQQFNFQ